MKNFYFILFLLLLTHWSHSQQQITDFQYKEGEMESSPSNFIHLNDKVLFTSTSMWHGHEVWVLNKNDFSVSLLKDIHPGVGSSFVDFKRSAIAIDGGVYFIANNHENGRQIWYTDGTPQGTRQVTFLQDFNTSRLTLLGNDIFFTRDENKTLSIWKYSIASSAVIPVKTNLAKRNAVKFEGTANGIFFFVFQPAGSNESRLWRSDGTSEGTLPLTSEIGGHGAGEGGSASPTQFITFNNQLYFVARDFGYFGSENSVGVLKSDGSLANTKALEGFYAGNTALIEFADVIELNNKLYFSLVDANLNRLLIYETDGETGLIVADIFGSSFSPSKFNKLDDKLVFTGPGLEGTALFKFDPSTSTMDNVKELDNTFSHPGFYGDFNTSKINLLPDGKIHIAVYTNNGFLSWISDLTPEQTLPKEELANMTNLISVGDTIVMGVDFENIGNELGRAQADLSGLQLISNLNDGKFGLQSYYFSSLDETLLFATSDIGSQTGNELYKYDPLEKSVQLLKDINPNGDSNPYQFSLSNGLLYFSAFNDEFGYELWSSDGSSDGTTLVKDVVTGSSSSFPNDMQVLHDNLFFIGRYNGSYAIYQYDGNELTVILDGANLSNGSGFIRDLITSNNALFAISGQEIIRSDGTAVGTERLPVNGTPIESIAMGDLTFFFISNFQEGMQLWVCSENDEPVRLSGMEEMFSDPGDMFVFEGQLYFSAESAEEGRELWVTDGTNSGTRRLTSINPGAGHGLLFDRNQYLSVRTYFAAFDSKLFFGAHDGINGYELWTTDGTTEGTHMIRDINPGPDGSIPQFLYSSSSGVYFNAYTPETGTEVWYSDGTSQGTYLLSDILEGSKGSNPNRFHWTNNGLIMAAYTPASGYQLWRIGNEITDVDSYLSAELIIYPNPASEVLNFSKNLQDMEVYSITGKKVLSITGSANKIQIEMLPAGLYIIRGRDGQILKSFRFIKRE